MKNENEKYPHTLAKLANLAKQTLNQAKSREPARMPANDEVIFHQEQQAAAKHVSSILGGLYKQRTASQWEWLRMNKPEWWTRRIELENEVDRHFLAGELEAAKEPFYQLVDHLKAAPIDELSSKIARQLDTIN
ncbi:hypothetical protein DRJ25_05445 [Candidatus Woesearchaeota archaeon]|nr:MAG: hypothetical protein DRJ25_05445 [Candidatus Woesearchaeota archaeon]